MAPQTVIIVGGVLITVGAGFALKEYAWPHVKDFVEPKFQKLKVEIEILVRTAMQHARGVPAHQYFDVGEDEDSRRADESRSVSPPRSEGQATGDDNLRRSSNSSPFGPVPRAQPPPFGNLRRRAGHHALDEDRVSEHNVEMRQLDRSNHFVPMSPTLTQPAHVIHDINPFEDYMSSSMAAEDEALNVPLPQSPASSMTATDNATQPLGLATHVLMQPTPRSPQPGLPPAHSLLGSLEVSGLSLRSPPLQPVSPPLIPSPSPPPVAQRQLFSPPMTVSRDSQTGRGARSPSLSEMGSVISAAPSRGWTDAGADQIFSDSERDFQGTDSDEDEVRSVSDDGSWQSVSAGSPALGGAGRLAR